MKKLVYILFFFISIKSIAQLNMTYSFGIISNSNITTYTNPISYNGKNCFKINSGLSSYINLIKGVFSDNCLVNIPYNTFNVLVYPNPAIDYTYIKFKDYQSNDDIVNLTITDEVGTIFYSKDYNDGEFINSGYKLNTNEFKQGVFYLVLKSKKIYKSLKLIKL